MRTKTYLAWSEYHTRAGNETRLLVDLDAAEAAGKHPDQAAAELLIAHIGGTFRMETRGLLRKQKVFSVEWPDPDMRAEASPVTINLKNLYPGIAEEHQAVLDLIEQVGWTIEAQD